MAGLCCRCGLPYDHAEDAALGICRHCVRQIDNREQGQYLGKISDEVAY